MNALYALTIHGTLGEQNRPYIIVRRENGKREYPNLTKSSALRLETVINSKMEAWNTTLLRSFVAVSYRLR